MLAAVPTISTCANSSSFIFFGIPWRQCVQIKSRRKGVPFQNYKIVARFLRHLNFYLGAETFAISNLSIAGAVISNHNLQILRNWKTSSVIHCKEYYITLPSSPTAEKPFFQKATSCAFWSKPCRVKMCSSPDQTFPLSPSFLSLPSQRTA